MSERSLAKAVVTFTVELELGGGGWGDKCTVGQVHSQAKREAIEQMGDLLTALRSGVVFETTGSSTKRRMNLRVIEEPLVRAVIVSES